MWGGNQQGQDYHDPDWSSGSKKKRVSFWPVVIAVVLVVVALVLVF